ncbi:hypothetical protein TW84_14660 [Vibrio neptunius]|nr:hypothetical protein TW84_14660 [Vibrio neptunius]
MIALRIDGERAFIKLVVAMLLIDVFYLMHTDGVRGKISRKFKKGGRAASEDWQPCTRVIS